MRERKQKPLMERIKGENKPKLLDKERISLRTNSQKPGTFKFSEASQDNRKIEESYTPWNKKYVISDTHTHTIETNTEKGSYTQFCRWNVTTQKSMDILNKLNKCR